MELHQDNKTIQTNTRRQMRGRVVGNKMQKTLTLLINRRVKHLRYGKTITRSTKVHAHNEIPDIKIGDWVLIEETRPISKMKSWKVLQLQAKDKTASIDVAQDEALLMGEKNESESVEPTPQPDHSVEA